MIFDHTLILSNQQEITASAASTNVIDLGEAGTPHGAGGPLLRNLGIGACIPFLIQVTEDFAAAGAATLNVQLQTDDNDAFASPTTVWQTGELALADLPAGANLGVVNYIPKGVNNNGVVERYFRLNYVVATGPMTAGKITAGVVAAVQTSPLV